jgi:hypothetical protein
MTASPMKITLSLKPGPTPIAAVHERIVRTMLGGDGEQAPERRDEDRLSRRYHPVAVRIAVDTWRRRMAHEHESAAVFAAIVPQLMEAGATVDFKTTVLRCAMDEFRHAALCEQVIEFLGGDGPTPIDAALESIPRHDDCSRRVAALRNLLFASLTETVSMGLLTEERERVEEPFIARVLRQLASDESLHARVGWTYLAALHEELTEEERKALRDYMPVALPYLERSLLEAMPLDPGNEPSDEVLADVFALGFSDSRLARAFLYESIETVILPRLDAFGLEASKAWHERERPSKG